MNIDKLVAKKRRAKDEPEPEPEPELHPPRQLKLAEDSYSSVSVPHASISSTVACKFKSDELLHKEETMLNNAYARELFFRHTNIMEVAAKKNPGRSETIQRNYADQCYTSYVVEPKYRIRSRLEEVRFDTHCWEGLYRMALKIPLTSAQEHDTYNRNLAKSGIKQLLYVDMTRNNRLFEMQNDIIKKLKEKFRNWSGKLDKLSTYLTRYQKIHEQRNRYFLYLLKHKSSIKDSAIVQMPHVLQQLVEEIRLPCEKRKNALWEMLRFDDDAHNKKFGTGDYSKFPRMKDIESDEAIANNSLPRFNPPGELSRIESPSSNRQITFATTTSSTRSATIPSPGPSVTYFRKIN
uniref:Uncharacterized protein n=1 Tax=Anopheles culicifacies TaxID=139723 RepID=A0A182M7B9_9DIPT